MSFLSKYYKIFEEFGIWLLALILVNVKEIILHSTYLFHVECCGKLPQIRHHNMGQGIQIRYELNYDVTNANAFKL